MNYPITDWRKRPPRISRAEMEVLMREAISSLGEAGDADSSTLEGTALYRMKTLARLPSRGIPENADIERAVWLFLGVTAFPSDKERTRIRLREAALAAISLTHSRSGRERETLRQSLGEVGEAAARLIFEGIKIIGE